MFVVTFVLANMFYFAKNGKMFFKWWVVYSDRKRKRIGFTLMFLGYQLLYSFLVAAVPFVNVYICYKLRDDLRAH